MTTVNTTTGAELRSFVDRVVSHLEQVNGSDSIELPEELFWSIPSPDVYDVNQSPQDLTIGSFADCLEFLRRDGANTSWMSVWLGQLLIGIGHTARL
jgi:hypothetical protein